MCDTMGLLSREAEMGCLLQLPGRPRASRGIFFPENRWSLLGKRQESREVKQSCFVSPSMALRGNKH